MSTFDDSHSESPADEPVMSGQAAPGLNRWDEGLQQLSNFMQHGADCWRKGHVIHLPCAQVRLQLYERMFGPLEQYLRPSSSSEGEP